MKRWILGASVCIWLFALLSNAAWPTNPHRWKTKIAHLGSLDMELEMLDQQIKTLRPAYYAQLNPPLDDKAIAALEIQYHIALPAEVRALYAWKNGQRENCYAPFIQNRSFSPLEDVLSTAANLTGMIGFDFEVVNWWNKDWLPIFHNGGGDYLCYDMGGTFTEKKGQMLEFWHDEGSRNIVAPDLEGLLHSLNAYYASKPVDGFGESLRVAKAEGYPKRFRVE